MVGRGTNTNTWTRRKGGIADVLKRAKFRESQMIIYIYDSYLNVHTLSSSKLIEANKLLH